MFTSQLELTSSVHGTSGVSGRMLLCTTVLALGHVRTLSPPAGVAASPGTTALTSPPGFAESYEALRTFRSASGRPLVHLGQLRAAAPDAAAKISERVDFDVPNTTSGAVSKFFGHPTA